ncbi:class A beta-lactamase [Erythrobacter sp.]|uniref:class A beta-lactamase n=1 Tax=Erythrobacter sp. TaxID=1042 RepID=UPI0025E18567|nr:class A beta-lactamase [Erythrobacter sp.]
MRLEKGQTAMKSVTLSTAIAPMFFMATFCATPTFAHTQEDASLRHRLELLAQKVDGKLGVCALESGHRLACVNGDIRFSLQSVMKLVVGAAVMEAVDQRGWRLTDKVVLREEDLSLHVQPLARIVRKDGEFRTTIGDLVERAVTQSDSAATDYLFARLGGSEAIRDFLVRSGVAEGLRIDRDERHLQTEISGVTWQPEFVDPLELQAARARLSHDEQRSAFAAYLRDERDTATPLAMATFLDRLARGEILSPSSTEHFLEVLKRTKTFPTRLRAGAPDGWAVAHKTGTSHDSLGVNAVTNDVGILTRPNGTTIAIAAFLGHSRATAADRDAAIAAAAREVGEAWK